VSVSRGAVVSHTLAHHELGGSESERRHRRDVRPGPHRDVDPTRNPISIQVNVSP